MPKQASTPSPSQAKKNLDANVIGVRLLPEEHEKLRQIAIHQDRPVSSLCRLAIRYAIKSAPDFQI